MKKLALFLCGLGSLAIVSVSAATTETPSQTQEPQNQEYCQPVPCVPDTCNQLPCNVPVTSNQQQVPCNPAPCSPDTVCTPAPCYTANVTCGC